MNSFLSMVSTYESRLCLALLHLHKLCTTNLFIRFHVFHLAPFVGFHLFPLFFNEAVQLIFRAFEDILDNGAKVFVNISLARFPF